MTKNQNSKDVKELLWYTAESQQGLIRPNPMFVLNSQDQIEYVAADPEIVKQELDKLFEDIKILLESNISTK